MVEGVEQLEIYFGRYLPQFFYALLAPITLFFVILPYSFKAALILLICVPLIPISIIAIMKIAKRILKNYWKSYSNLGGTFLENLQGLTTLKVFNQDEARHNKMNQEAESFRVMTMKVLSMQLNSINIMDLVAFGGAALGTIVALLEYRSGQISVGHLIVIILLSAEFFIPMRLLGSFFHIAMNGMKIAKRILKNYWKSYSNLGGTFLENLQGLTTLKVFNQDEARHNKMNQEAESFRVMTMKVLSMQLNSINIMDLVAFGGAAIGTIVALLEYRSGQISVGHLIVIILLSAEFFIPMRLLGSFFHIAMNGMAASDRIFKVLDTPEIEEKNTGHLDPNMPLSLDHVDFSYDEQRPILKDVSLTILPGQLTAIVGESGSGKSTIASLLLKNYTPQKGKLSWGHTSYSEISSPKLYEHLSLVSTNSYILGTTIRENLLMARPHATQDEIQNALQLAQLDSFIASLKEGLDTPVGEGGSLLSGGQKQRLALARAILANRDLMIFDEATSNVDVESEEAIWQAIYELAKTKTVLVISHRLASIKAAHSIYVMKQGCIVEKGTHEQLYLNQGEYFQMVNKQNELEQVREVL